MAARAQLRLLQLVQHIQSFFQLNPDNIQLHLQLLAFTLVMLLFQLLFQFGSLFLEFMQQLLQLCTLIERLWLIPIQPIGKNR